VLKGLGRPPRQARIGESGIDIREVGRVQAIVVVGEGVLLEVIAFDGLGSGRTKNVGGVDDGSPQQGEGRQALLVDVGSEECTQLGANLVQRSPSGAFCFHSNIIGDGDVLLRKDALNGPLHPERKGNVHGISQDGGDLVHDRPCCTMMESVWDYPRPPRLEPNTRHLQVVLNGVTVADTTGGFRVLETSHPPVYYFPPDDVDQPCLSRTSHRSFCEFKGSATYWTVSAGDRSVDEGAWSYASPSTGFEALVDHLAFYCGRMDACLVDGEKARPQPGGFYGGWITNDVVGPFKGEPGSSNW
jgi:uncharacterized protein (DUF427 family)